MAQMAQKKRISEIKSQHVKIGGRIGAEMFPDENGINPISPKACVPT